MNEVNSLAEIIAALKVRESELVSLIDEVEQIDPGYPAERYVAELAGIRKRIKKLSGDLLL